MGASAAQPSQCAAIKRSRFERRAKSAFWWASGGAGGTPALLVWLDGLGVFALMVSSFRVGLWICLPEPPRRVFSGVGQGCKGTVEYRSARSARGYAAKVPCTPDPFRYASKRGGPEGRSTRLTRYERMERKHSFPRPVRPHDAGPLAAPRPIARQRRAQDLQSARAQRARSPRASEARSAGTARRRQGLKPVRGETRAAGLDAQRESPARSEAEGDARAASQVSATSACATATGAHARYRKGDPLRERQRLGK